MGDQIFTVNQSIITSSFHVTSVAVETFASVAFSLGQIDQASTLAALFDQYRINSVECYLTNQASNSNLTNTGHLVSVVDFDDSTNLTSVASSMDYSNALVSSCQSCQYRRFVPHAAIAAYSGAFTSFANVAGVWIDSASPGVAHFGLKTAASVTSTAMAFDLTIRLNVSFKSCR